MNLNARDLNKKLLARRLLFAIAFSLFFAASSNAIAAVNNENIKSESKAVVLGEQVNFFVDVAYDAKNRSQIIATFRKSGLYANFYIEDEYWNNLNFEGHANLLNYVNDLADEFDGKVYPRLRDVYGSEWSPGIDNDSKINILLTHIIQEAGGYFNPNDEYLKSQIVDGRSNEREIIYLNVYHLGDSRLKSFLAHEFQHMINWYQKNKLRGIDEDIWLNEALSEYASTVAGFDLDYQGSNLESRVNIFLKNPTDALTEWTNSTEDYGSVNMFMQYLVDQYGTGVIRYILSESVTGIAAINNALKKGGYNDTFTDVFRNWAVADLLNNSYVAHNNKYSYKNSNLSYINFHVTPTVTYESAANIKAGGTFQTKEWSPRWYVFNPSSIVTSNGNMHNLNIEFVSSAQNAQFDVTYLVYSSGGEVTAGIMNIDARQKGSITVNDFGNSAVSVVIIPINKKNSSDFNQNDQLVPFSINASLVTIDNPVIDGITPSRSNISGGLTATIAGVNFNNNSKIYFDNKEISNPKIVDSNTIEIMIPPHDAGQVDIKILNQDSKYYTLSKAFTYFSFADGTLIRAANDYKVYIVNGKYKRWIQSPDIFNFYQHFAWNKIVIVSVEERDAYQTAALVRAFNDYKVYEINGDNTKHWVNVSPQEFIVSGRRWDMVQIINEKERDFYATGPDIR